MDPQGAFVVAIALTLLNGMVLGLMHRDLPLDLRPGALSWLVATLLISLGCVVLALPSLLPTGFGLPLANTLVCLGLTGYWRALRQFYGVAVGTWMLLPALLLFPLSYWYTVHSPDLPTRVVLASLFNVTVLLGALWTLWSAGSGHRASSRLVLAATLALVIGFLLLRAALFVIHGIGSIVDGGSWINLATPLVVSILPVVGTTAFQQMCSERLRSHLEIAASTDPLTGLANRRTLVNTAAKRIDEATRGQHGLALGIIDIDHFKRVNDRHGHDVGDRALIRVAEAIAGACRPEDLVARQGGEEFVVLFDRIDVATALRRAEEIRAAVEQALLPLPTTTLRMTVSIGLAVREPAEANLDAILKRADAALYQAKAQGRNQVIAA